MKSFIRKITVCLFAVVCLGVNFGIVANATEVEAPQPETSQEAVSSVEGSQIAIIEIEGYTIDGGMIEAGKEITVNFKLHNTATDMAARSVLMTMSNSTGAIYPVYGNDNQVYVGNIGAGKTKEVSVPLTIGSNFTGNAVDLSCNFEYETADARMTNTATIVIPTSGGSTIGVKSIDVTTHAIVNGKSLLSFNYVNQSSSNITDAELVIDGNVSSNSKRIKLDTVYAGKSYTQDYYVIFTEPGDQEVNVSLTYTDTDGETVLTDLGTFSVTVSKDNNVEAVDDSLSLILRWVGLGIAGVVGIIAVVVIALYIKKR
ncbi:hypothetical protein [Pseudobutyrivibrio xylanivorans]|uniref:Uncharacterized protein n=1 Tax=Pseudobutyrivibrio xylanivorans TaxID=185007 RepID=A0A5P6VMM9_PSEXY|nr:hypothetical protein [Pseudobutyrivibrio xylanivorans]QFJ53916.1 hypothetical protein FXF36_03050 [Pseudobutyrivibrio xylanivorans]